MAVWLIGCGLKSLSFVQKYNLLFLSFCIVGICYNDENLTNRWSIRKEIIVLIDHPACSVKESF